MFRGWFIGDFEPSVYKTKLFEVGKMTHKKDEIKPKHYHKIATEINVMLSGKMILQGNEINIGDIFIFEPGEIADPIFLDDCEILVVKIPSIPGDKYEV
jgi:quercetin dioxygenase-like cupin family protein